MAAEKAKEALSNLTPSESAPTKKERVKKIVKANGEVEYIDPATRQSVFVDDESEFEIIEDSKGKNKTESAAEPAKSEPESKPKTANESSRPPRSRDGGYELMKEFEEDEAEYEAEMAAEKAKEALSNLTPSESAPTKKPRVKKIVKANGEVDYIDPATRQSVFVDDESEFEIIEDSKEKNEVEAEPDKATLEDNIDAVEDRIAQTTQQINQASANSSTQIQQITNQFKMERGDGNSEQNLNDAFDDAE